MKRLAKIFLRNPGQWQFWVVLALLVKGFIFLFQISHAYNGGLPGFLGSSGGDTETYILPIDHLLDTGSYDPDYRMPGYGIFYLFFRFCFAKETALNSILILQYVAASISVYALALSARKIFQSIAIFYVTFYLFLVSTYSNLEDATLLTESFATSFLVFAVYFLSRWYETNRYRYLILSGLFTTEVIFLRPVFAPMLLLFVLFVMVSAKKSGKKYIFKYALILMVPFMLIDGVWIGRNYVVHKRIIPLTTIIFMRNENNKLFWAASDFLQSWGGNYVSWDPSSEMRYFNIREKLTGFHKQMMRDTYTPIPNDIYTSAFNADSLAVLKNMIADIQTDTNTVRAQQHINDVVAKFDAYTLSVKKERPFVYYIKAPLRMCRAFMIHSGTYNLFPKSVSQLTKFELMVKIVYSLFYILSLILGFIGLLLLIKKSLFFGPEALITGVLAYNPVIHSIVLRLCEARYFMPAWPFLLVCVAYTLLWARKKLINKKNDHAISSAANL